MYHHHQKETSFEVEILFTFLFLSLRKMATDDSVASLYALYKPIWAAEEADRCTRWAAFLSELAGGGDEDGGEDDEEEEEPSTSAMPSNPSALPLSPSTQAAGLAALDALIVSWRQDESSDGSGDDEPRREKLARLRALAQAGLPMVRKRRRRNRSMGGRTATTAIFPHSTSSLFPKKKKTTVHPRPALGLLPRGPREKSPRRVREALRRRGGGRGGEEGESRRRRCQFLLLLLCRRRRC